MRVNPLAKAFTPDRRPAAGRLLAVLAGALLLATTLVVPAAAQGGKPGPSPAQRPSLEELRPVYLEVIQDPTFHQLRGQLRGNLGNRVVVDRYLDWLPLSPLEMLKIEMREKKFEIVVPRLIAEWHLRWLDLHGYEPAAAAAPPTAGGEAGAAAVTEAGTAGPNHNVAADYAIPPELYQGEIQVVVNPGNPNQVVAAANTWDDQNGTCGDYGLQAVFFSSDGGTSWGYSCPPNYDAYQSLDPNLDCGALGGGTFGSDPALSWDDQGNVYLNHMMICYNGSYFYSMVVAKSTDGGATWSAHGVLKNSYQTGTLEDKNFYLIDNTPTSPYYGRHYSCWDRDNNELLARSLDGGVTWTESDLPATSGSCRGTIGRYDLGCEMAIDDNGTVYTIYNTLSCGVQTCKCEQMFFSVSTDGGANWSAPLKVNDDATSNIQFHPFLTVDEVTGDVVVAWHDARNDPDNDQIDYYLARSTDCGVSFEANVQVTSASAEFNNSGVSYTNLFSVDNPDANPNQYGEYLGLDAYDGKAYVAWTDSRHYFPDGTDPSASQDENVGFAVVTFPAPVCNNNGVCEAGEDCQNCANDCIGGGSGGASCGNGLCEAGDGEDCVTCASDCNGVQSGKPANRFCCGFGGTNPVGCANSACTTGGFQCTETPVGGGSTFCCGNGVCETPDEDAINCAIDCL